VSGSIVRAQVVARGVAVFDHPLCRGQDKGTLAESARPDSIEFSCDRVNGCRRPTMLCVEHRVQQAWAVPS
jgi:hypothetical protein